jgi:hypothetical protein
MLRITYHYDSFFNALIEASSKGPVKCHYLTGPFFVLKISSKSTRGASIVIVFQRWQNKQPNKGVKEVVLIGEGSL